MTKERWHVGEVRHGGRYQLVCCEDRSGFICEVQAPLIEGEIDGIARKEIVELIASAPQMADEIDRLCSGIDAACGYLASNQIHAAEDALNAVRLGGTVGPSDKDTLKKEPG